MEACAGDVVDLVHGAHSWRHRAWPRHAVGRGGTVDGRKRCYQAPFLFPAGQIPDGRGRRKSRKRVKESCSALCKDRPRRSILCTSQLWRPASPYIVLSYWTNDSFGSYSGRGIAAQRPRAHASKSFDSGSGRRVFLRFLGNELASVPNSMVL